MPVRCCGACRELSGVQFRENAGTSGAVLCALPAARALHGAGAEVKRVWACSRGVFFFASSNQGRLERRFTSPYSRRMPSTRRVFFFFSSGLSVCAH